MLKHLREPVSGLMHYCAALVAVVGLVILLVLARNDAARQRALLVYGASLVLMLMASAAYHLIPGKPRRVEFLRKIDHSAIYVLIAGTYTPICGLLTDFAQWGILSIVWGLALVGAGIKIFTVRGPRWLTAAIYVLMGWLGVLAVQEAARVLPAAALVWLALGGIIFTLGAVVYVTKILDFVPGIFGFHESWHVLVVLGCLCHFIMMLVYVAPGAL